MSSFPVLMFGPFLLQVECYIEQVEICSAVDSHMQVYCVVFH
jgi:hypothetical protein